MIDSRRKKTLNDNDKLSGKYVLYWMQAAQRVELNHALEHAVQLANSKKQPLITVFCLVNRYPMSNLSHYRFMIEGLQEIETALQRRGIAFSVIQETPMKIIPELGEDASIVVVDRDYQRMQRGWREDIAERLDCPLHQIETNVVVPIETVSQKEEYTAGTLRPKLHRLLDEFLAPLKIQRIRKPIDDFGISGIDLNDCDKVLRELKVDGQFEQIVHLKGGTSQAKKQLKYFIKQDLQFFADKRNDPAEDHLSKMSPYLHFGQISPVYIALELQGISDLETGSFLEELIVRRELSMNFVFFNRNYDNFECLPNWAKETLELHSFDHREYVYSYKELEQAKTHDPYWNAAQREMVKFGKMHGYMRMYWGKKILEWSESPFEAYVTAVKLNDTYELDGRDPNGYAGIAWCFGKHDRAWSERPIFGKVRYMNNKGLKRKFDIAAYVQRINGSE
ncbi:MAG: deoxyribodipyrimidine photo-lyase [Candidatus Thorarchaeota archaeon]|nr:deoxyribodipyrimidine photo-lyase [Candidatus Thorarchaeota archaeon]